MLECIKFGICKIKAVQIGNEWFVAARHIAIVLDVSSGTFTSAVQVFEKRNWY